MNFSDLTTYFPGKTTEFELRLEQAGMLRAGDFVNIVSGDVASVKRVQDSGSDYIMAEFITKKYRNEFEEKAHGETCCQIKHIADNIVDVMMLFDLNIKHEREINPGGIVIAALDGALKNRTIQNLNSSLHDDYAVELNNDSYYLMGKHQYSRKDNSFILADLRRGKYLPVISKKCAEVNPDAGSEAGSTWALDSTEQPLNHLEQYAFILYGGDIRFEDKSKLHRLSEITRAFIQSGGSEYVNIWRLYAEKQWELEQKVHDDAGVLSFESASVERPQYYRFHIKTSSTIQKFLKNARKQNGDIQVVISQKSKSGITREYKAFMSDKLLPSLGYVECRFDDAEQEAVFNPTLPGTIEVDLTGAKVIYERRMSAFDAIQKGNAANSALPYLIDGNTVNTYAEKELNDSVKLDESIIRTYFKDHPPNPNQRRAIEIALHTPDIAVIQGPPGTGKTKVIKTIYAHLAAKEKNVSIAEEKYLLTAYQRDATKNMAEGIDGDLDLPIIAYYGGSRSNTNDSSLRRWCEQQAKRVTENNPNLEFFSAKKRDVVYVNEAKDILLGKCSVAAAQSLLEQVIERAAAFCGEGTAADVAGGENASPALEAAIEKVQKFKRKLDRRVKAEQQPELVFYTKVIPTSKPEMDDGGYALVQTIIGKISCLSYETAVRELLNDLDSAARDRDYKKLSKVKTELILQVNRIPDLYDGEKQEAAKALDALLAAMKLYRMNIKQEILSEYRNALYPSVEVQQAISKYQRIVAATHQLASSKGKKYKDVLIDEAARSCPADLMIPLAKAENRIILVGDHKQLPQFIEDQVLKSINPSASENAMFDGMDKAAIQAKYECSMFEYMIDKCASLCKKDPAHERVIQLNIQYRMPPVIGSIVSKNFYNGKLCNSDLPLEHFMQDLPGVAGKNLIWIDLSKPGTTEKRSASKSIFRECEADTIAEYIRNIAASGKWDPSEDSDDKKKLGVITFYSKQKAVIYEKLVKTIGEELAKKVEVGTVDSFQGKEFEIVFLSLVRNNYRDDFGFLNSKNRMCVALSRSIKCLVVVGSSRIIEYAHAKEEIPALIDVYNACKNKEGGVCELRAE